MPNAVELERVQHRLEHQRLDRGGLVAEIEPWRGDVLAHPTSRRGAERYGRLAGAAASAPLAATLPFCVLLVPAIAVEGKGGACR